MEQITERLTDDAVASRMLAQIEQGYTAPEVIKWWLIYIKLNQLEKNNELIKPKHCSYCGQALK